MGQRTRSLERAAAVRLTGRDYQIVRLVCEQGAVAADDVGIFMSTHPDRTPVSQRTRNGVLRRLKEVGLVWSQRWSYTGSAAVFPTRLGAKWTGWSGRIREPGFAVLRHELTVAAVRVRAYPRELGWAFVSERSIQLGHVEFGHHRPDGIAVLAGRRIAVEVQLSVTDQSHITSVITSHLDHFDEVAYWCAPGPAQLVRRVLTTHISTRDAERVRVRELGGLAR